MTEYREKKSQGSLKIQEFENWKSSVTAKLAPNGNALEANDQAIPFGSVIKLSSVEKDALVSVDYFERIFDDGTKILLTLGNGMLSNKDAFSNSDFSVTCTNNKESQFRSSFRILPYVHRRHSKSMCLQ